MFSRTDLWEQHLPRLPKWRNCVVLCFFCFYDLGYLISFRIKSKKKKTQNLMIIVSMVTIKAIAAAVDQHELVPTGFATFGVDLYIE